MSLNYLKREKNFIGVIEKGYPRIPENVYSLKYLLERLGDEYEELKFSIKCLIMNKNFNMNNGLLFSEKNKDYKDDLFNVKKECADLSNMIDFIFEIIDRMEKEYK